jgi:hypothetical protein
MKPDIVTEKYKALSGRMQDKCLQLCQHFGFHLQKMSRKGTPQKLRGDSDGLTVRVKSLRDKYDLSDFFHEIGHCFLHYRNGELLHSQKGEPVNASDEFQESLSVREKEANDFAKYEVV